MTMPHVADVCMAMWREGAYVSVRLSQLVTHCIRLPAVDWNYAHVIHWSFCDLIIHEMRTTWLKGYGLTVRWIMFSVRLKFPVKRKWEVATLCLRDTVTVKRKCYWTSPHRSSEITINCCFLGYGRSVEEPAMRKVLRNQFLPVWCKSKSQHHVSFNDRALRIIVFKGT